MSEDRLDLATTYMWIDDDGGATRAPFTPDFWPSLITGQTAAAGRWLLGAGRSDTSPLTWDRHPNGECVIILLSGSIDVVLDESSGERVAALRAAGDTCVIPRGVWHRQIVNEPSNRIFLTAGEGTDMRPTS